MKMREVTAHPARKGNIIPDGEHGLLETKARMMDAVSCADVDERR
jgi:hypothetical protein